MALFNRGRKRGTGSGEVVETNPHSSDPLAPFKAEREPYGYETLSPSQRTDMGLTELRAGERANNTEVAQGHLMMELNPEHSEEIKNTAVRNMDENDREMNTRSAMLSGASIQNLDRMYKANNAAHRAQQRAKGVPEHEIMDMDEGFEVSGDAISRLKAGKPAKLSTQPHNK